MLEIRKEIAKGWDEVKGNWIDWGNVILRAAVILLALFYFCWPVRLEGRSMEPTMQEGDLVLTSRFFVMTGGYEKGDIVLFRYFEDGSSRTVIKRIIATEGDEIEILPEGVMLNGMLLEETYAAGQTYGVVDMKIPKDTVFVMGDNREESYDSRNMGVIAEKDLQGKILFQK